jgi:hypothetical protein
LLTVSEAADAGDRRSLLVALRARIATDIDDSNTPARAIDANEHLDEIGEAAATPDEAWERPG